MTRLRQIQFATISLAALLFVVPQQLSAATATTTFGVSANVLKACVVSASAINFNTYNPVGGAAATATSTLTVACTATTSYTTGLSAGGGSGASVTARKMTGQTAANTLPYSLYQDAARSVNWGNTPGTDTPAAVIGTGLPQTATVYGQIAANTPAAIDSYTDSITVTVTY